MTYLVARIDVVYDEEQIVKEMLETGEYGIGGYPISEEAMVEFVKAKEFGFDHEHHFDSWAVPLFASISNEDGTDLWYYDNALETTLTYQDLTK